MKIQIVTALLGIAFLSSSGLKAQDTPAYPLQPDTLLNSAFDGKKIVNIPFNKAYSEDLPGFATVINPEDFLFYDNIGGVSAALSGKVPGMISGTNLHGLGTAVVIIDGIPGELADVNIEEVEQITILRDVNSAIFYGVQAGRGVIMITTKRGKIGKPKAEISVDLGASLPISLPKFLGSADYMELFNEARLNDGLGAFYDSSTIASTRSGVNPYRFPDTDYYSSDFLKSSKPFSRYRINFSGGTENTQYFLQVGVTRSGSLLEMGEKEQSNGFNLRSNVNFKVNNFMKAFIDIVGRYDIAKGPNGSSYWSQASTLRPNLYTPIIDTSMVSNVADLINPHYVLDGKLLGGTSIYKDNLYGNLLSSGYQRAFTSVLNYRTGLDVDLGSITKGLSFKALVSFTFNANYTESQNNTYAIYEPIWSFDSVYTASLTKIGEDKFTGTQGISGTTKRRRIGYYGSLDYNRVFNSVHAVSASVLAFSNLDRTTGNIYEGKYNHLGLRANYVYDNKYIIDFNSVLTSALRLSEENRLGYSPSIGLGWVISNENFFNVNGIDYLKLKASAGTLKTDYNVGSYYLYNSSFSSGSAYNWADGTRNNNIVNIANIGNSFLNYEKRKSFQLGVEAGLLNNALFVDVSYFSETYSDKFGKLSSTTPDYLGGLLPTVNFGEDKYSGIELGLSYKKRIDKFSYEIGGTFTYLTSEVVKTDEDWENDYQFRAGKRTDAIWGLQADGLFTSDSAVAANYYQSFGAVRSGDIKYINQNSDTIVDANDIIMLGNSLPDFSFGLNLRLSYGNFTFFTLITGTHGAETYFTNSYYQVYGDVKYSETVLNRWTPETAQTATYPKLSSGSNSNNFRNSSFWLYDNSRISINRVQLTYDIRYLATKLNASNMGIYIKADNIAMFAKNRDKIQLNHDSEPDYRSYSVGIRAIF